ncbi:hypothetical protein [Thermococcus sp. GR6]|uniref:hypothetical protein n=1 Tax=Thermococcus sp. GR6 TaxID=1638256 RepID=UPI0014322351|nr:hypothetical protein [Thermococcus sp. GR6]NJE43110.1 hypothetical protein [Thermococcus sp. GR6]
MMRFPVCPVVWPGTARLGDSVGFDVDLVNTYSVDKSVRVKLEIDGIVVDVVETTISAGHSAGVLLHWNVPDDFSVGEHTVKIQAWSRDINSDEDAPWNPEDSETGPINVERPKDLLFGKLVPNVDDIVVQGTVVHFDVIVENKNVSPAYNVPIRVLYTYQDPNGEFSDSKGIFERKPRQIDGLGTNITWFEITLTNPGKHYFTLYVNGEIEDEKIITVISNSSVVAWMTCSPEFVSEDVDSVSCRIEVENLDSMPVDIWITDIYFAGGKIYDRTEGDNLIASNPESLTLNPDYSEMFTFTIPINGELQKRVPVDLSDINLGTPIAIQAYLNQLKEPVTYVIEMNPRPVTAGDVAEAMYSGAKWVKDEIVGTFTDVRSIAGGAGATKGLVKFLAKRGIEISSESAGMIFGAFALYVKLWIYVLENPIPGDDPGDNNLIIGD